MNNEKLDAAAAALLIVGGLNWGLVAIAEFDLVAWIFGEDFGTTNAASRIVYGLVGLAAVYGIAALARPAPADGGPSAGDRPALGDAARRRRRRESRQPSRAAAAAAHQTGDSR